MKILCLIDWQPSGRWVWDYLPENRDVVDFVTIRLPKDRFPGYGKLLGYYPAYGWLGIKALLRQKHYDVVVTWEGKNGVPLAFLRTCLGKSAPPMVILNFVLKGQVVLDLLWFTRFALKSVNRLTCISQREIEDYAPQLGLARERFVRLQGPWPDYSRDGAEEVQEGDFIFASGRSHRDYRTLIEAVRGLPIKVVINAQPFNIPQCPIPENVVINSLVPYSDFLALVRQCRFMVIPLYEAKHASGESVMMQGMAARKTVVATETYSTAELIEPGVNGLLVPPGDVAKMRQAIQYLLEHPDANREMGFAARRSYEQKWSFPVVALQIQSLLRQVAQGG